MWSKTAVQCFPESRDRHTPPSAVPANQVPSEVCAKDVVRPPTMEKPEPMLDQKGST